MSELHFTAKKKSLRVIVFVKLFLWLDLDISTDISVFATLETVWEHHPILTKQKSLALLYGLFTSQPCLRLFSAILFRTPGWPVTGGVFESVSICNEPHCVAPAVCCLVFLHQPSAASWCCQFGVITNRKNFQLPPPRGITERCSWGGPVLSDDYRSLFRHTISISLSFSLKCLFNSLSVVPWPPVNWYWRYLWTLWTPPLERQVWIFHESDIYVVKDYSWRLCQNAH